MRAQAMLDSAAQQPVTTMVLRKFAATARKRMRIEGGGYRRDHLRALAQRVEVADREVRIMGSKSDLLRTLAAISGVKSATGGVRSSVLDWRREWDSNPRYGFPHTRFPSVRLKPLGHLSGCPVLKGQEGFCKRPPPPARIFPQATEKPDNFELPRRLSVAW
jgi:site-specific DNA recombinase